MSEDDLASAQDRLAAHIDRPEEEEVLLAPRLDFTPGGSASTKGAGDDIQSPFAGPERKKGKPPKPAVRTEEGDPGEMVGRDDGEALSPTRDPSRRSRKERRPPLSASPSLAIEPSPPRSAPAAGDSPAPASNRQRISDISGEMLPSMNALLNDIEASRATPWTEPSVSPLDVSDGHRPETLSLPERRAIDMARPMPAFAPEGPSPLGRMRRARGVIQKGTGACLDGLRIVWNAYSRGCSWAQTRLAYFAGWMATRGRAGAFHLGWLSTRLGRGVMHALRIGAAHLSTGIGVSARHASAMAKMMLTVTGRASATAIAVGGPALTSALRAGRSSLAAALAASTRHARAASLLFGRLIVAVGRQHTVIGQRWTGRHDSGEAGARLRSETVVSPNSVHATSSAREASTPAAAIAGAITTGSSSPPAAGLAKALSTDLVPAAPPSLLKASTGPATTVEPAASDEPAADDLSLAARLAAWRLTFRSPRLALAGLAAASVAFLFVAFGPAPASVPVRATLTLSIPERQPVDTVAAAAPVLPTLPSLSDPIANMVAYIEERQPPAKTATGEAGPVLAGAESVDGLDQFTRAAEVVGLGHLLQPDESYTIFVPNDDAFARLPSGIVEGLLDPSGHERLLTLLSHHIVPERLTFDDIAGRIREFQSLAGQVVTIDATDVIRIGGAGMIEADLPLENGVLHVIDQVIALPKY